MSRRGDRAGTKTKALKQASGSSNNQLSRYPRGCLKRAATARARRKAMGKKEK